MDNALPYSTGSNLKGLACCRNEQQLCRQIPQYLGLRRRARLSQRDVSLRASKSKSGLHQGTLKRTDLVIAVSQMATLGDDEIVTLPGVSVDRAHQMRAGAVVAEATMALFDLEELEICPWALREGVLLRHMDQL